MAAAEAGTALQPYRSNTTSQLRNTDDIKCYCSIVQYVGCCRTSRTSLRRAEDGCMACCAAASNQSNASMRFSSFPSCAVCRAVLCCA